MKQPATAVHQAPGLTAPAPKRLVCLALLVAAGGCFDPPVRRLVVRAGRLVDGTGAPPREGVRVVIEQGSIVAVEADAEPLADGRDTSVLDARALTVMPGLINSHVHLFTSGACTASKGAGPAQAARNLHALLAAGVTTAADLSAPAWLITALRRHVGTARHRGPRLLVSGPMLTAPSGYLVDMGGREVVELGLAREIDSPKAARLAVRELADVGVDFIKVALQERSFNRAPLPLLEAEPLCAVVEEAHEQELRVLAHALTIKGYTAALDCGVDAIMHAPVEPLDDALLARLLEAQVPVTPTLFIMGAWIPDAARVRELDRPELAGLLPKEALEDLRDYARALAQQGDTLPPHLMVGIRRDDVAVAAAVSVENTRRMHASGVPLAVGTDAASCFAWHGSPVAELLLLEQAGLTPLEALSAATSGAACILDLQDAIGKLVVGYRADLIAVEGRPDEQLRDITRVRHVLIDGIEQTLEPPGWIEQASLLARVAWAWVRS